MRTLWKVLTKNEWTKKNRPKTGGDKDSNGGPTCLGYQYRKTENIVRDNRDASIKTNLAVNVSNISF